MFQRTPHAPPLSRAQAAAVQALKSQYRVTPWPYHSTGKIVARQSGGSYVLAAGTEIRLFSYGRNESKVSAGFTSEDGPATPADTNLIQANQTIGNQDVYVRGMAMQLHPRALDIAPGGSAPAIVVKQDADFIGALFECVAVELSLNGGESRFNLGTLGMIAGAGGLTGAAGATASTPPLSSNNPPQEHFATNGWATVSNNFKVKEGLVWKHQGSADSQLNVILTVTRGITIPVPSVRAAALTPATDNFGIVGFTAPSVLAVEIKCILDGLVKGDRSSVV